MKGLLAGICAGGVVGAIGLAIGLTVVPLRDPAVVSEAAGDNPEAAAPIFSGEPSTDPDPASADPEEQVEDDAETIFAQDGPALGTSDAAEEVEIEVDQADAPSAELETAQSAEREVASDVPPAPEEGQAPEPAPATEPAAELRALQESGSAAELAGDDAQPDDGASAGQEDAAALVEEGEAATAPPPTAQVLAPRAPVAASVQTDVPELALATDRSEPRDGMGSRPAAPPAPEHRVAQPAFDDDVPPPSPPTPPPAPRPRSERLPQVGEDTANGDAAAEDEEAEEAVDTRPALVRNAAAEPPAGVPLLALVLMDRPGAALIDDMPLSVAIAADAADAGARADAWRAAGAEIVAIPGLPDTAARTGPLAVFDATFDILPQAATVMAESAQGFAGGPVAANEIAATLAETGHGLIVRGRDPGPFAQAAERAGVPTVGIFRRVDGSGRDGRAVGRFLDQAAFEARNRGAVVVIADNTPETAEGIERFLDSSRADTVAIVPVSAILRRE